MDQETYYLVSDIAYAGLVLTGLYLSIRPSKEKRQMQQAQARLDLLILKEMLK